MNEQARSKPREGFKLDIPADVTNEQILVAAAIVSDEARGELLRALPAPDFFVDESSAAVWSALIELHRRREPVDLAAVQASVAGRASPAYVAELCAAYPKPPVSLARHVEALRWDRVRAEAVRGPIGALLEALRDPAASPDRVRALGKAVGTALDVATDKRFMRDPAQLAREMGDELRQRGRQAIYPVGIAGLDAEGDEPPLLRPGASPGTVTVVTGVSGNGKSVVSARMALKQACMGRRVLYGAWEMGALPTLQLMAMMSLADDDPHGPWTRTALIEGSLLEEEVGWLQQRAEEIGQYVRFFDPPFTGDVKRRRFRNDEALDQVAYQIADSGCEVYVLDLWERMIPDAKPEDERRALFRQQQISQETGTHGVLVAQQKTKEIEASDDKRPTRGGILGSGAWVEISDHILGVYRPALYKRVPDDVMEVIVLKQRFGRWPVAVSCRWDGERCQLSEPRQVDANLAGEGEAGDGVDGFLSGAKRSKGRRR